MKKELVHTIEYYLNAAKGIACSHRNGFIDSMSWDLLLKNLKNFEQPDGYSVVDNTLYVLEHFEFDSTKATKKKGSKTRIEDARIEREFDEIIHASGATRGIVRGSYNISHSSESYIANATRNLVNHYGKIDSYIENLRTANILNDEQLIKIGFFIEDSTILGNAYSKEDKEDSFAAVAIPIILCRTKQFLDLFDTCDR